MIRCVSTQRECRCIPHRTHTLLTSLHTATHSLHPPKIRDNQRQNVSTTDIRHPFNSLFFSLDAVNHDFAGVGSPAESRVWLDTIFSVSQGVLYVAHKVFSGMQVVERFHKKLIVVVMVWLKGRYLPIRGVKLIAVRVYHHGRTRVEREG